jgi:hypothetical protein
MEGTAIASLDDLPPVFYRDRVSVNLEGVSKLAYRVALSGAFPGAFPTSELRLSVPIPVRQNQAQRIDLKLALADGGIRDNLGLNVLELANLAARLTPTRSDGI